MSALLIILSCVIALVRCQVDSQNAAILKDTRYLSGDGTFGSAYSQEDGVEFKEESDEYGNRRGSYSYVDPTGQRRTVTYTAGVNGFQASGDHIPSQPPPTPPQPEYVPLPQYNPPDYQPPQSQPPRPPRYQLVRRPYEPQYETQEASYDPQPQQPRFREISQPRIPVPRYNRPLPAAPELYNSPYAGYPVSSLRYESKYESGLPYEAIGSRPAAPSRYRYNEITTPAPRRFYPPGKLDFNRTPDGFSYTFSKS